MRDTMIPGGLRPKKNPPKLDLSKYAGNSPEWDEFQVHGGKNNLVNPTIKGSPDKPVYRDEYKPTPQPQPTYDPRQAIMDEYKRQNEQAKDNALKTIDARLKALMGDFDVQKHDLDDQYQAMINQSELNKYRSRASVREALANRGQLDSGLGRQEALNTDIKFGNQVASIQAQKQRALNDIQNQIARLKAETEAQKTNVMNSYNNAMSNLLASMM